MHEYSRLSCSMVHGIGGAKPSYSVPWGTSFNPYLKFPDSDFLEVLWSTECNDNTVLTPEEQAAADEVCKALTTMFLARASAQQPSNSPLSTMTKGAGELGSKVLSPGGVNLTAYIGEFAKYLVSKRIRTAVKEKMKEKLRPLAASGNDISIISHSWGTVVSYDSLLDLQQELPTLKVKNLFTLGSPLWAVQLLLDDRSGYKPGNTATWVNIHAVGDPIGSWLQPGFQDDKDFPVAPFLLTNPHGGYLAPGNVAVQRDIVAATILPAKAGKLPLL